jgi:PAS domain S-box-containing protein
VDDFYRLVLTSISDTVFLTDDAGRFTFVCPNAAAIFGHGPEEVAALEHIDALLGPDLFDPAELEARGELPNIERTVLCKDGAPRMLLVTVKRVAIAQGTRLFTCRDVSERKRMEETLRRSEERYRMVAEFTHDWEIWQGEDGAMLYVSPSCERVSGYPREGFLRDPGFLDALVLEPDRDPRLQGLAGQLAGSGAPVEFRLRRADGRVVWLEQVARRVRDEGGAPRGCRLSLRDVTARKETEQALRERELETDALLDASESPIGLLDAKGRLLRANEAMARVMGRARQELKGLSIMDYGSSETARRRMAWLRESVRLKRPIKVRDESDSKVYWSTIYPIVDADGEVRTVAVHAQDITEVLELERGMRRSQKMEALGTLAGGVAHDFNNILGGIYGFTRLARQRVEDAQAREDLDQVLQGVERAKALVRQLLTFSRSGNEERRRPLRLAEQVGAAIKFLRPLLPASMEIVTDFKCPEARVQADADQLQQVLVNLFTNSAQALADSPGLLRLGLEEVRLQEGAGRLPPGDYVRLTVHDTGPGMERAVQERVFDPFFTTKEPGQGTGLGLATVLAIVQGHGGDVSVHSAPGRGATFRVLLPCCAAGDEPVAEPAARVPREGAGRVLLVDDEPALARVGKRLLQNHGYRVRTCVDSREAMDAFLAQPHAFDLLITDQTMPHMSGLELARRVRGVRPDMPVLLCTGHAGRLDQGASVLADRLLRKPVTEEALLEAVHAVLNRGRADGHV